MRTHTAPIRLLKEIPHVQSYLNYDMYFTKLFNEPNLSNLNMYSIQTDLIFLATQPLHLPAFSFDPRNISVSTIISFKMRT